MVMETMGGPWLASDVDARAAWAAISAATSSRAERLAARVVRRLQAGGADDEVLSSMGVMARSSMELERHLAAAGDDAIEAFSFLERFVHLRTMSAGRPMRVRTSIPDLGLSRDLARCVALVLCELVEVVELAQTSPPDLMLALEERERDLVVALAAVGGDAHPVPTGDGAAALRRAEHLVEAHGGGLTRGVRDRMMLVGLSLPVRAIVDGRHPTPWRSGES